MNVSRSIASRPMITLEKMVRGKRTTVSEPLFPNYLFVEFDPEVIHTTTISATRGVSHFVRFGAMPATVPYEVIEALRTDQRRRSCWIRKRRRSAMTW